MNHRIHSTRNASGPADEMPVRRERLWTLQYVRAIAAIAVVIFHVGNTPAMGFRASPALLSVLKVASASAVDIFFILSGFIMVYTQDRAQRSAPEFAWQRLARIAPLYWITTLATVLLSAALFALNDGTAAAVHYLIAVHNFTAVSAMFVSHLFGYENPVVLPGWSLEYEMLFYVIFSLAILTSKRHYVGLAIAALTLAVVAGAIRPLCIEFAMGSAVAVLWTHRRHRILTAVLGLAAPIVVAFGLHSGAYTAWWDTGDMNRLIFCGLPMLAVFCAALCAPQRKSNFMLMLGDASYAIYVTHCLWLLGFTGLVLPHLPPEIGQAPLMIGAFVWCVIGGIGAHYLVEKRCDSLLRRAFIPRFRQPHVSTAQARPV